jgi:hypothetical protein
VVVVVVVVVVVEIVYSALRDYSQILQHFLLAFASLSS